MTSVSHLHLRTRFAIVFAVTLLSVGCAVRKPINVMASHANLGAQIAPERESPQPALSIFDIKSFWWTQDGISARLETLSGGPLVIGMVNTSCAAMCGITIASMKNIERTTDATVRLVLVTLDAQRGTPEILAAFAKARGLSSSRWTLVSGSAEATRELAAVLNVRDRKRSAEQLARSSMLSVIDENGVLVHQQGFGYVAETVEALNLLLAISH